MLSVLGIDINADPVGIRCGIYGFFAFDID